MGLRQWDRNSDDRELDDMIREIVDAIRVLEGKGGDSESDGIQVLNNSAQLTGLNFLYGFDSSGKMARSLADSSALVPPRYLSLTSTAPGSYFTGLVVGRAYVRVQAGEANPTLGARAYLSQSTPGAVTFTRPTSGKIYAVGWAAATSIFNNLILLDLHIHPVETTLI